MTSDYLLKIFRASIPHMPKTAAAFGQELQLSLQPMILKPTASAGVIVCIRMHCWSLHANRVPQGLQETVACTCAVVQHLTHDFSRLTALLKSCNRTFFPHFTSVQPVIYLFSCRTPADFS